LKSCNSYQFPWLNLLKKLSRWNVRSSKMSYVLNNYFTWMNWWCSMCTSRIYWFMRVWDC
jgi:hypothetical protein